MHRSRKCPPKPNGITVRDSPQPEFCNTIGEKADARCSSAALADHVVLEQLAGRVDEAELGSVFDDQATQALGEAFEAACKVLDEAGQSSVVYEAVTKCIIEIAKSGERDPNLRDRAAACGHKRLMPLLPDN